MIVHLSLFARWAKRTTTSGIRNPLQYDEGWPGVLFPRPFGGLDRLDSSKNRFKRFFKESQQAVATIDMRDDDDDDDEKWAEKKGKPSW